MIENHIVIGSYYDEEPRFPLHPAPLTEDAAYERMVQMELDEEYDDADTR